MIMKRNKNIIIVITDAWKPSVIQTMIEDGQLPNIQSYFLNQGLWIKECISTVPTVSLTSHASLLTGCLPKNHGVLGHRWLLKKVGLDRCYLGLWRNDPNLDIDSRVRTIYEIVSPAPSLAIFSPISRGATKYIKARSCRNKKALKLLIQSLQTSDQFSATVCWLPEVDFLSHMYGCDSNRVFRNLMTVDSLIGEIFDILSQKGSIEDHVIALVSDHGHRNVQRHLDLSSLIRSLGVNAGYGIRRYAKQKGPKNNDLRIFLNGQAAAYVYAQGDEKVDADLLNQLCSDLVRFDGISVCLTRYGKIAAKRPVDPNYLSLAADFLRSRNAPDLLVFSDNDYDFGNGPRMGIRFGYHKSTHGGISIEEMATFAAIWDQSINGRVVNSAFAIDILPTVLNLAGYETHNTFDGASILG
jgi:predicted AlkP superfamily pyrophosphatase or phosphodiesterase